ncbi:MAG: peptide deformylase [Desulfovibrio sp.]|jgi:peptide deformylase|nr:peptide deformylase [Desulfovibrio sp.]
MILEIVKYPDERLKVVCEPVEEITDEIRQLCDDMLETMYAAPGVGLAAPQIGVSKRLLVMDPQAAEEVKKPRVLINPRLELLGETVVSEQEGCLSVPLGYRADVPRSEKVRLTATLQDGTQIDEILEGYEAIIVQHEYDHLDGKLFIDHISRLKRNLYDTRVKKWLKRQSDKNPR